MTRLDAQHQAEIQENQRSWRGKPLLQEIYRGFYQRILAQMRSGLPGCVVEIGSGIGNLKSHLPQAICTDLFPNPWLDLVCDGYELPFRDGAISHLILFDVFHHLEAPRAFLREARRALAPGGRLLLFEPYVSVASWPAYGMFHHEPVRWSSEINQAETPPRPRAYYAAQGNATRIFFREEPAALTRGWDVFHAEAFASFSYLLSGGFSKPALYPQAWLPALRGMDEILSVLPRLFAARCLIGLTPLCAD